MRDNLEKQIKDLFEIVEVRYLKKQKEKTDFLMEVKNMEKQLKIYSEKINESLAFNELLLQTFNYIKLLECDILKANTHLKHSHLWLIQTTHDLAAMSSK